MAPISTKEKIGFFEEAPGVKSLTRLLAFILTLAFIGFVFLYFYVCLCLSISPVTAITTLFILLTLVWLIAIFTPKYLQKILEIAAQVKGLKLPGMDAVNTTETSKITETSKKVEKADIP
jgi:hypothetical protein